MIRETRRLLRELGGIIREVRLVMKRERKGNVLAPVPLVAPSADKSPEVDPLAQAERDMAKQAKEWGDLAASFGPVPTGDGETREYVHVTDATPEWRTKYPGVAVPIQDKSCALILDAKGEPVAVDIAGIGRVDPVGLTWA